MAVKKKEKDQFYYEIETMVTEKGIDYIDAVTLYCKENNMEPEVAAKLVNATLKRKIASDALTLRMIEE